jgi:hypothetical protein
VKRVGIAILAAVPALTGCSSAHHTAGPGVRPKEPVVYGISVPSPDGKRVVVAKTVGETSYLEIGPAGGGPRHTVYHHPASIGDVYWAFPNLIVFNDNEFEISTLDLRTHQVLQIATASSFNMSRDGRWLALYRESGPHVPMTVAVVRTTGGMCLVPPRPANRQDTAPFFKPGVQRLFFTREPFSASGSAAGPGKDMSLPLSRLLRTPSACG